jgi:hypothetical protein
MRRLFSDGANSFAHVVLGVLSVWNPLLIILFFLYEFFKHPKMSDAYAGILEFLVGYAVALISESRAVFPSLLL